MAIILTLMAFSAQPSALALSVSFVIVATQQYALLIIMHDGQHGLLHPNLRVNNLLSTWLIGAPCGAPFRGSRVQHLMHHRKLGSPTEDPAFVFYCYGEPAPKHSPARLLRHFAKILLIGRIFYTHNFGLNIGRLPGAAQRRPLREQLNDYGSIVLAQAVLFSGFATFVTWWAYFILWVLPLVTLVSFFDAFRQFVEHAHPVKDGEARTLLISTRSNWFERIFFSPFGMNYHAEHHLFPFVPFYRLAEVSKLLRSSEEEASVERRSSYIGYVADYVAQLRHRGAPSSRSIRS